jgi:beta-N-acetylhexosaminidase
MIDTTLMQSQPLESWLGQMVFAQAFGRFRSTSSADYQDLEKLVTQSRIGGFKIYHGYALGTTMLLRHLRQSSDLPLLIAADLEQGLGQQIMDAPRFPAMAALGAADDENLASRAGRTIGEQALKLGINLPFTPLLDVSGPDDIYFGVRCLGSNANSNSAIGSAFIKGIQASGAISVVKYFPGHGRQRFLEDGSTLIDTPIDSLLQDNLPFSAAIRQGVDAVMVGPGAFPALDSAAWPSKAKFTPAMLSKNISSGLLRQQWGFQGVIISDALNLPFLRAQYSQRELAAQAVRAGCDILVALSHPEDALSAIGGIKDALEWGWVTEEQIWDSLIRIMSLKARIAIFESIGSCALEKSTTALGTDTELALIEEIAQKSIQLIKGLPVSLSQIPMPAYLPLISIGQHETVEKLRSDPWKPWHNIPVQPSISFQNQVIDSFSEQLLSKVISSANSGWIVMALLDSTPNFIELLRQTAARLMHSQVRIALILPISYNRVQDLLNCGDIVVWCADFYQPSRTAALNLLLHHLILGEAQS